MILVGILAVVVVLATRATLKARAQVVEQYSKLADALGLELTVPETRMGGLIGQYPSIYGHRDGREMSVSCYGYGLSNTRQTDTAVVVSVKHEETLKFVLSKRNLAGRLGQLGRNQDIALDDDTFSELFLLRGSDTEALKGLMDKPVRELILSQWPADSGFLTLGGGKLTYVEFGLMLDEPRREHIQQAIRFMDSLIKCIEK